MAFLSNILARVRPSATLAITDRVRAYKEQGRDVISLSAGEPDFDTPDHIKQAAMKAIEAGDTKYTAVGGTSALKQAICNKLKGENGLSYTPDQVIVGTGGKQVIYNALMASLNEGDEVVIPAPYWVSYPDMVQLAGGTPRIIKCDMAQGFKITPALLAAALTPRTKWLIFNSPANPTGAAYEAKEIAALGEVLQAHKNVWVLADEIYEHLVYDGFRFTSFARAAPALYPRTLTMNGVSKAFSMTGWRIGYGACANVGLIKGMEKLQGQSTSNPSSISQAAALGALTGGLSFLDGWRGAFLKRRNLVVEGLDGMKGLSCPTPKGAFYVYASCEGLIGKTSSKGRLLDGDEAFALALLEETGVAVVHGAAFGLSPFFRISYATSEETLNKALARIKNFCDGCR